MRENLKKQSTEQDPEEEAVSSKVERQTLLPAKLEWLVLVLCSILFFCIPLYYLSNHKCWICGQKPDLYYTATVEGQNENRDLCEECSRKDHILHELKKEKFKQATPPPYELLARKVFSIPVQNVEGLIAIRSVDAEYKLAVFLAFASLISGIVICGLHLKKSCIAIPKPLVIFGGLFIGSVLISSLFAHNFQRAWVSSLLWHFVPVLFAFSLANVSWNRKKITFCASSLLIGGIASCLIAMDQHYDWSKWDWRGLLASGPAGLIYNHNFAAEYHAPLLPIALGLLFYVRSIGFRIALGLSLAFVLLPALSLSLARGAWVGLIGGCICGLAMFLVAWLFCQRKSSDESPNIKSFTPLWGLLALGLALPVYILTSRYWGDRVGLIGQCILGLALFLVTWLFCRCKNSDQSANIKSFTPLWGVLALGLALPIYILTSPYWGDRVGLIGGCIFGLAFFLVAWLSCRRKNSYQSANIKSFTPLWGLLALGLALPVYILTSDHWKKGAPIYNTTNVEEGGSSSSPSSPETLSKEAKELTSIIEIGDERSGSERRLVLWPDALNACLSADLFFGKGTDHYELHFHESAKLSDNPPFKGWVRFVHNDFIQTLYENGLLGLIGFLGIWIWILWKSTCSCLNLLWKGDLRALGLRLGLVSGCLVFLIESFFEFPTRSACSLMVGWACLGVLSGLLLGGKKSNQGVFRLGAKLNLLFVALGILTIPHGLLVAKDLFWTKVYHVQATVIEKNKKGPKESALKFHRKAISHAPWEFRSRIMEHYYLINVFNQKSTGMEALEETLRVHPGCLLAHQNKIEFYLQTNNFPEALKAHSEMGKAAPFHPTTKQVRMRIDSFKLANLEKKVANGDSSQGTLGEIERLRRRLANP